MNRLFHDTLKYYRDKGYTEEVDFPYEYRLLINPETMDKIRVYYNGLRLAVN